MNQHSIEKKKRMQYVGIAQHSVI